MTVRYVGPLATNSNWGCFTTLLFKWRGSVYKLIWAEYLVFIVLYYMVFFFYRFCLSEPQQRVFEVIAHYCEAPRRPVEMSFVLGFFVTTIVRHWWQQYQLIPWPDTIALYINASIRGNDPSTKLLRKNILRYCNLSIALTFHSISPAFRKVYPNLKDFVKIGLLKENEKLIVEKVKARTNHGIEWLPMNWATEIMSENKRNETKIMEELDKFRRSLAMLQDYESVSVPLVYVQVVTISVYTYFLLCLVSRQWLIKDDSLDNLDLYFPFFTTLQFIFHMGWFKVAESLINPFGSDDDDFELDKILKRHLEVTQLVMDTRDEYSLQNSANLNKSPAFSTQDNFINYCYDNSLPLVQNDTENFLNCVALPPPNFADVVMAMEMNHNHCTENRDANNYIENHTTQRSRRASENFDTSYSDNVVDDGF